MTTNYLPPIRRFLLLLLGLIASLLPSWATTIYTPITDNKCPAYIGVYEGSVNGDANPYGITRNATYATWLNRTVVWGHDTLPEDWANIEGEGWILQPWGDWVTGAAGSPWAGQDTGHHRRLVLSVPVLPGSGNTPLAGCTLANGASGLYNSHFQLLAQHLVAHGLGNSILRLGWEWNGNWYPWKVQSDADATSFAGYWQQIVTTMRAVPGAQNLQFCWNPSNGTWIGYTAANAWPGDNYVDYVGDDVYDKSYATASQFNPTKAYQFQTPYVYNSTDTVNREKWVWQYGTTASSQWGIAFWANLAAQHGKPLCFPEWGLCDLGVNGYQGGFGGEDDTYFLQQMFNYIQNPANNVAWASYFDYNGGASGGNSIISGINGTSPFPNAATLFQTLLKVPSTPTTFVAVNGNAAWPYLGINAGAQATANVAAAAATLNYTGAFLGLGALDGSNWSNISGQSWELSPWQTWTTGGTGRRLVLTVPILPTSGATLAAGATGTYNSYFTTLAQNLVTYGQGNAILRLGPDFNTGNNAWHATTDADALNYALYWRQIVTTMRNVTGADKLQFDWDVTACNYIGYNPDDAFPGNSYVDYVGMDFFDYSSTYYSGNSNTLTAEQNAWSQTFTPTWSYGLNYWSAFAVKHFKPLAFPQWGLDHTADGHGGGDDAYYTQQMFNYIQNPQNNVYWQTYYNINDWTGDHLLFPTAGGYSTEFPNAGFLFEDIYSAP